MMMGSEGDRERQERAVAEGAGNAVADLKAGFGAAAVPADDDGGDVEWSIGCGGRGGLRGGCGRCRRWWRPPASGWGSWTI